MRLSCNRPFPKWRYNIFDFFSDKFGKKKTELRFEFFIKK